MLNNVLKLFKGKHRLTAFKLLRRQKDIKNTRLKHFDPKLRIMEALLTFCILKKRKHVKDILFTMRWTIY